MDDMSDLELVAQAMAPTENPAPKPAQNQKTSVQTAGGKEANGTHVSTETSSDPSESIPDLSQIPALSDLDPALLASLSLEDRTALLPLLAALQRAETGLEGGEDDDDLGDMAEILRQMDQAGEVADELEDKLDRLIRALGEEEEGLNEVVPAAAIGKGTEKVEGKEKS